jgi:PKD repeat protein
MGSREDKPDDEDKKKVRVRGIRHRTDAFNKKPGEQLNGSTMTGIRTAGAVAWIVVALLVFLPAAAAGANCSDVETGPMVDFSYAVNPAESGPITVNFYSTSDGGRNSRGGLADPVESYAWRFGDGDVSEQTNPLHTYAMSSARYEAPDKPYGVTLIVKTACGRSNATTKNVPVYCLDQKAGFMIVRPAGDGPYTAPVALNIRDTSLHVEDGVTVYHYTLWDSGMTRLFKESTEKDPTFVITNSGSYIIRQEVLKGCSNASPDVAEMKMAIEVTGASDAIPMETIPFTTTVTENSATAATVTTPAPAASASPATTPAVLPAGTSPGTGMLSVNTSPAGAQVFVNDVLLGSSPVTIPELKAGSYILRLEKSGYRTKTVRFEIADGRTTEYAVALEPESGGAGLLLILAAVIVIAAGAGAAYWYVKKKQRPVKHDWNNP